MRKVAPSHLLDDIQKMVILAEYSVLTKYDRYKNKNKIVVEFEFILCCVKIINTKIHNDIYINYSSLNKFRSILQN